LVSRSVGLRSSTFEDFEGIRSELTRKFDRWKLPPERRRLSCPQRTEAIFPLFFSRSADRRECRARERIGRRFAAQRAEFIDQPPAQSSRESAGEQIREDRSPFPQSLPMRVTDIRFRRMEVSASDLDRACAERESRGDAAPVAHTSCRNHRDGDCVRNERD
jgi:hypothetical protein